ncbi:MAG: dienelactone hydrolase family protein [Alphaproteobacteria bacterium]
MTEVTISAKDGGTFSGYLATPGATPAPGIVLVQEIFGVNAVMRALADGFANQGYVVLCPDLFWRQEPGIQITDQTEEEWAKAFELYQGFDEAKGVDDLIATLDHLRGLEECTGTAGCVGYCLGGKLAYLMATRSDADCVVGYYGVGIEAALDEASNITKPLLLHIGEEDQFVSKDAQAAIKDGLAGHDMVAIHSYPGMDHAFARVGGEHYDAAAANLADGRSAEFLKAALG